MAGKKLVIFGVESTARIVHWYFKNDSDYEVVGFTLDSKYINEAEYQGLPVVPFEVVQEHFPPDQHEMIIALGYNNMNKIREAKYNEAKAKGYKLANYISTRCSFLTEEPHGDNIIVMEDNTIQPFVKLGSNLVFWSGNHIGHETEIGDNCFITSHVVISGHVKVGSNCFFGVNSSIRDAIEIAHGTLVGAGAVIMKSTEEKGVYLPARSTKIDKKSDEIQIS